MPLVGTSREKKTKKEREKEKASNNANGPPKYLSLYQYMMFNTHLIHELFMYYMN